jgi:hypothetical protein
MIDSGRMRWAGYVARVEAKRNAYRILVRKPEGKRPLKRPRQRGEEGRILKYILERSNGVVWTGFIWLIM